MTPYLTAHTTSLTLLIVSAWFHAYWNSLIKGHSPAHPQTLFLANILGFVFLGVIWSALAVIFFEDWSAPTRGVWIMTFSAGICEAGYLISLAKSYQHMGMGYSYGLSRAIALIAVWVVAVFVGADKLSAISVCGLVSVLLGIFLTDQSKKSKDHLPPAQIWKGRAWVLMCGLWIAGYHLSYDWALQWGAKPLSLFTLALGSSIPLLLLGMGSKHRTKVWTDLKKSYSMSPVYYWWGGAFVFLSFSLFLMGLEAVGPGTAIVFRNISILFALYLAKKHGENIKAPQWVGALLIVAGLGVLSLL